MRTIGDPTKEEVKKRMLASGKWVEGENGELIRVPQQDVYGFPTTARAQELSQRTEPLNEQDLSEFIRYGFSPTNPVNTAFSMVAGAHPVGASADILGNLIGRGLSYGSNLIGRAALRQSPILPTDWDGIINRANQKLKEGLGIKTGDDAIELVPMPVDVDGTSFPSFDVEVRVNGKTTGHMSFDPIDTRSAEKIADERRLLMGDVDPEYGLIRNEDFPFEFEPQLQGRGLSGEMTSAINESLKDEGFRLYSSFDHTPEGARRYINMAEKGYVEPIDVRSELRGRYRFNKNGGKIRVQKKASNGMRVLRSWPPDEGDPLPYTAVSESTSPYITQPILPQEAQSLAENQDYKDALEEHPLLRMIVDDDLRQRVEDQQSNFYLREAPPYLNTSPYPTISAVAASPELREEQGRANPAFTLMEFLTPVGDLTSILGGVGDLIRGDYASGAVGIGSGLLSAIIPGSIPTGKASTRLYENAGKNGVSVKSIRQAASGKDVSASEASLLNTLADRAENAGLTHVDPGNMQMGGMQRLPRFRGGNTNPEWDEFFGTDRLMGLDWNNLQNMDAVIREARRDVTDDSEVILLKGDDVIYGNPSKKHFSASSGPSNVGVHAHVRAIPDPWETLKAKRGEPSRNVRSMLEIQSDAFQSGKSGRWEHTYHEYGDEPIFGSKEVHRMVAEDPGRLEEIFENVEHVGQQVIGYLNDKGFGKGKSLQDVLGLEKVVEGTGSKMHRDVGLLQEFGGTAVAAPEGEVAGFSKLLEDLIEGGDITRQEADDFLVAYSRFGGEGHYDFNFSENITEAEAKGRRIDMADDLDMEVERPNVTREHPWTRVTSELLDIGVNQMRREVKDPDFLKHVDKIKNMPDPSKNPMSKTWEREALAAFFEDGAKKGAEAYRFPTTETVRTIQGWDPNRNFDMILNRYQRLPDQMEKMGVDVSQITNVTDGFGNTWLEIPVSAVPASVKVYKIGGRIRVNKAKKKGMRVKK
jgi:hypothetical protein